MALPAQGDPAPWGTALRNYILAVETAAIAKADKPVVGSKAGDQSFATAVLADVTSLGLSLAATSTYDFEFYLPYTGDTNASSPITLSLAGPTNTFLGYSIAIQNSSSGRTEAAKTAVASSFTGAAVTTALTIYAARISGRVTTTASGTLIPQAAGDGTHTCVVKAGAWGSARLVV
jgi:hypothetical protein